MGNSCTHCFQGVKDCCSYFSEGCEACYVCMHPCCVDTKNALTQCCVGCNCAALALCMECNMGNPCIILDRSTPEIVQALSEYEHRTHYNDDWFGDVILLEHKQNKSLAVLKTSEYYYEKDFKEHYEQFITRKQLKHDNIVQLREFVSRQEEGFCTSIYKSFLIFDYILCDFATEFQLRVDQKNYYTEDEFWPIIYQCVSGMAYLHSQNIPHGAIRMRNIFITPEVFKMADPHLFEHENDYAKIFSDRRRYSQFVYLSPEQMAELDRGESKPELDLFKCDVYSMGMVFLQLCSRTQSMACYNYDQCVIYEDKINSNLQTIKLNCHDALYFIIKNMLTVKAAQRPTFKQVQEQLEKHPKCKQPIFQPVLDIQQQPPSMPLTNIYAADPLMDNSNIYDLNGGTGTAGGLGLDLYSMGLMGADQSRVKEPEIENVKERYPDGSKYIGSKRNGLRHGKGKFIHSDQSYYDGQWKDNKMAGKGVLYNSNAKVVYDGHWNNDQYNGTGTEYNQEVIPMISAPDPKNLTNVSWAKYEGHFKDDFREGFGTLMLSNGDKFVGGFKHGMVSGHGTYYAKSGKPIQGKWIDGILKN